MTETCPDCAVSPGEPHEGDCDVARCLFDGGQRLSCGVMDDVLEFVSLDLSDGSTGFIPQAQRTHDCGLDVWTGEWPGVAACREFGWWVQDRCSEGLGWAPCAPDAPDAMPDLNRLSLDARWSREQTRWVLR
jgi:hypothetical protein